MLFWLCCAASADLVPSTGLVENLLVNKLIVQYGQIESDLWQVIERREENTLEQIYNEHRSQLKENHFQNYIDRMRIGVDLNLSRQLKFLNESTTRVHGILQARDYGGLNRFAHSSQVQNISAAMETVGQYIASNELWVDVKDVRPPSGYGVECRLISRSPRRTRRCASSTTRSSIPPSTRTLSRCTRTSRR